MNFVLSSGVAWEKDNKNFAFWQIRRRNGFEKTIFDIPISKILKG